MENQTENFKKHSRTGSIISATGLIVVLLSVGLLIYFDRVKENKISTTENKLVQKDSLTTILNDSLKVVKKIIEEDNVDCNATLMNEKMADGSPLYMFTLKIKDPQMVAKLKSVDYFFNHSSFHPQVKTSTDYQNSFKLTYKGWGCLDTISVYLHYKEGTRTDTIRFPMCKKTKIELKSQ